MWLQRTKSSLLSLSLSSWYRWVNWDPPRSLFRRNFGTSLAAIAALLAWRASGKDVLVERDGQIKKEKKPSQAKPKPLESPLHLSQLSRSSRGYIIAIAYYIATTRALEPWVTTAHRSKFGEGMLYKHKPLLSLVLAKVGNFKTLIDPDEKTSLKSIYFALNYHTLLNNVWINTCIDVPRTSRLSRYTYYLDILPHPISPC